MTTPYERTRALISARKLLEKMQSADNLPAEFREEAIHILRHYPECWITESLARQAEIGGMQSPLGPLLDSKAFPDQENYTTDALDASTASAAVLTKAAKALGSRAEAIRWMVRPAMGLGQLRPIDLIETPDGRKVVEEFLGRLEGDVYS